MLSDSTFYRDYVNDEWVYVGAVSVLPSQTSHIFVGFEDNRDLITSPSSVVMDVGKRSTIDAKLREDYPHYNWDRVRASGLRIVACVNKDLEEKLYVLEDTEISINLKIIYYSML